MSKLKLIGLAGTFAAGKDTVSDALERDYGYNHVSTSEIVRAKARELHNSIERPVLFQTAQELRHQHGAGAMVIEGLKKAQPLIISGLRSLGEAKEIKKAGGTLVFIDAPIEVRYERMRSRDRDAETELTLEEFKANEKKEWHSGDKDEDFSLSGIKAMSDVVIDSNQPLEDFIAEACSALQLQ